MCKIFFMLCLCLVRRCPLALHAREKGVVFVGFGGVVIDASKYCPLTVGVDPYVLHGRTGRCVVGDGELARAVGSATVLVYPLLAAQADAVACGLLFLFLFPPFFPANNGTFPVFHLCIPNPPAFAFVIRHELLCVDVVPSFCAVRLDLFNLWAYKFRNLATTLPLGGALGGYLFPFLSFLLYSYRGVL